MARGTIYLTITDNFCGDKDNFCDILQFLGNFVGACGRFDLRDKYCYLELTSSKRIVPRMWVRRKRDTPLWMFRRALTTVVAI
ncbi:MAG: hypothetical protein ACJ8BW_18115 [Ktedonobacteraceae bacterium]